MSAPAIAIAPPVSIAPHAGDLPAKVGASLFGGRHCEPPQAPEHFQDVVVIKVEIEASFADRLKLLVSGRAMVETKMVTERPVGELRSNSVFYVLPPRSLEKK